MRTNRLLIYWVVGAILGLVSCYGSSIPETTVTPEPTGVPAPKSDSIPVESPQRGKPGLGYTYQRPDGNRYVLGRGGIPGVSPLHVSLRGNPRWVVGAPVGDTSIWAAVLEDGSVQAFSIAERQVQDQPILSEKLPPGMPPLLAVEAGAPRLIAAAESGSSHSTTPVMLRLSQGLAFIRPNGDLVVEKPKQSTIFPLDALPDARLLSDEQERILLLTNSTNSYPHGVLGDGIEAKSVTLVQTRPSVEVIWTVRMPEGDVVEGVAPIWSDLDGDGVREILVTVSNSQLGARLVVFNNAGELTAVGPAVGRGSRWRHQLAAAPFGPSGESEVADVLTPHIGGIVEFYRLEENQLQIVAKVPGFRSHTIGSRNLDMAVAGDFDGDGRVELLVPNQSLDEIRGIRRTMDGAEVAWTLPIGGKLSTNMAAVTTGSGELMLGVGREDGTLLIWPDP